MVSLRKLRVGSGRQMYLMVLILFDFIKSNLANDILKRVTLNSMSGSSWKFKRFGRNGITANSDDLRNVGK